MLEDLVSQGNLEKLKQLLSPQSEWENFKDFSTGDWLLHTAVKSQSLQVIEFLLLNKHPVNVCNKLNQTPICLACSFGNPKAIKALLEFNPDLEIKDLQDGSTPLLRSVESLSLESVKLIVGKDPNLDTANFEGETGLHVAIDLGSAEVCEYLIHSGASIQVADNWGNTPLHTACRVNNTAVLDLLISKGAKLDTENNRSLTPLAVAVKNGSKDCIEKLLEAGAFVAEKDVRLAREVARVSVWQYLCAEYKKQNECSPKYSTDSFESPPKRFAEAKDTICFEEVVVKESIGKGMYGEVFKGYWRNTKVALKFFESSSEELQREVCLLKELRHPNIVLYMGVCLDPPFLVTEYLKEGSLAKLLHESQVPLSLKQNLKILKGISRALAFLHSFSIVHRDLKPENCLTDSNLNVKLCDFGLSRVKQETHIKTNTFGTLQYAAPEVLSNQNFSFNSDVYSFGVLAWEVLARSKPYQGLMPPQILAQVLYKKQKPPMSQSFPFKRLIQSCWAENPQERPSMQQVYECLHISNPL